MCLICPCLVKMSVAMVKALTSPAGPLPSS